MQMDGARVLVVGASAGIGREVAVRAARAGASVAVSARRADRLADTIAAAGGGTAIVGDLRLEADCRRMVDEAASALGGLDLVVYSAGCAPLRDLAHVTADDLAMVFETNVFGVQRVVQAALGHLAPGAIVAVLSSESVLRPWQGLGTYAASKAAMEALLRNWQLEHPAVRFSCVRVGATQPTEFGTDFDGDALGPAYASWSRHALLPAEFMETGELAEVLVGALAAALAHPGVGVEDLTVRSPSGAAPPPRTG